MNEPNQAEKPMEGDGIEWSSLAMEEYKILQQKIDKIGDFRFKVKQWALTLFAGLVIAQIAHPGSPATLAALCGTVAFIMFWWMEREQDGHKDKFRAMILSLESQFLNRKNMGPQIATLFPGIRTCKAGTKPRKAWEKPLYVKALNYCQSNSKKFHATSRLISRVTFREVFYVLLTIVLWAADRFLPSSEDSPTVQTISVELGPVTLEPVKLEAAELGPVTLESVKLEAVELGPVTLEPVKLEPVKLEPVTLEPAVPSSDKRAGK